MKIERGQRVEWNGVEMEVAAVAEDAGGAALVLVRADGMAAHNVPASEVKPVAKKKGG